MIPFLVAITKYRTGSDLRGRYLLWFMVCYDTVPRGVEGLAVGGARGSGSRRMRLLAHIWADKQIRGRNDC